MTLFKSFTAIFTLILISCCSGQKTGVESSPNETINDITMNTQKMMEAGFKQASIVASDEPGDCPYTLKLSDGVTLLDPINLDESYKMQDAKIWVKYAGLKMMNRCKKANPVRIEEIQKRAD